MVSTNLKSCLHCFFSLRGTIGLLKYLKSRLTDEELQGLQNQGNVSPVASSHSPPKFPDKFVMKSLQAMNLAQKELTMLPEETVKGALEAEVSVVDLSKNSFSQVAEHKLIKDLKMGAVASIHLCMSAFLF